LVNVDGFGQDQIGADAKRFRHSGLTFHHGYRKRRLV
jgi:hypothetical protein